MQIILLYGLTLEVMDNVVIQEFSKIQLYMTDLQRIF